MEPAPSPVTFTRAQCPAIGGDERNQCIKARTHTGQHDNGQSVWA